MNDLNKFKEEENINSNYETRVVLDEVRMKNTNTLFEKRIATEQTVSLEKLRWLNSSEAAQYLRVSIGSIKNMVYRGQLTARKIGRRNRFLREDLERLIRFS